MPRNIPSILLCIPFFFNILGSLAIPLTGTTFEIVENVISTVEPVERDFDDLDLSSRDSPNPTHVLSRREAGTCNKGDEWQYRICDQTRGYTAYNDYCWSPKPDVPDYRREKRCPDWGLCAPTFTSSGRQFARCVKVPKGRVEKNISTKEYISGIFPVQPVSDDHLYTVRFQISHNRNHATVAAHLRLLDTEFIVIPNGEILGYRGGEKVCQFDSGLRYCTPTGKFNLKTGDNIDIKFKFTGTKAVKVFFSIVGHLA